jgi:hypothetical protein
MNIYTGAIVLSYRNSHPFISLVACAMIAAGITLIFIGWFSLLAAMLHAEKSITSALICSSIFTITLWLGGFKNEE